MKKSSKDILVIGFALFAMFFGAGNLIFPPYLGKITGNKFIISALGFIITGVGIPFLGIVACTKSGGNFENMAKKVGKGFSILCGTALFLAIGPMLGIPRTAATTYELTVRPIFPSMSPILSMIIYFSINLCFILKPSKIIDNIGKYLTPILLIALLTIIVKGSISPIGTLVNTGKNFVFSNALKEGYQTMDALGALVFASVIVSSVNNKGYKGKENLDITIKSGMVAIIGLAIVYTGLMYLGAQTSSIFKGDISKTLLLLNISKMSLGNIGSILIGIAIGLACFTTSVGLITAGATFFENVSKGKLPYKLNAIIIAIASIIIGSFGVDKIISISAPVLSILYPVAITLIITTLLHRFIKNDLVVKATVYTALLFSIFGTLSSLGLKINLVDSLLRIIPLSESGFAWIIPTLICFFISSIFVKKLNFPIDLNKKSINLYDEN